MCGGMFGKDESGFSKTIGIHFRLERFRQSLTSIQSTRHHYQSTIDRLRTQSQQGAEEPTHQRGVFCNNLRYLERFGRPASSENEKALVSCRMSTRRPEGPADEALIERFYAGKDDAFDELFRRYKPELERYLGTFGFCPDDRDMLAHEALVKLFFTRNTSSQFDPRRALLRTWLYKIAKNLAVDFSRKSGGNPPLVSIDDPCFDDLPGLTQNDPELLSVINQCWQSLESKEREVLYLYVKFGEAQIADIRGILGVSAGTASHLRRQAEAKLRQCLTANGVSV